MTNDALIDVLMMWLDSAAIAIVEFQFRSAGDMGDQLVIRFWSMRAGSYQIALWTDPCAKESTDGDLGDHGDQL